MMRRLLGAISLIGLMVIALPAGTAAASSAQHLTRIQSPRANQVVGANARVRVVVRSRESLAALRISVAPRSSRPGAFGTSMSCRFRPGEET